MPCLGAFEDRHLAQVAWGLARVAHADAALFGAIAGQAPRVRATAAHALLAWAFASALRADARLFAAAAERARPDNFLDAANLCWSFAKVALTEQF